MKQTNSDRVKHQKRRAAHLNARKWRAREKFWGDVVGHFDKMIAQGKHVKKKRVYVIARAKTCGEFAAYWEAM